MNIRKPVDYSAMFAALDTLMAADLSQMKLYCEIGRLVSGRPEKGAAVAAAEYLCSAYPDIPGFSPRNLRRMREFYRTYERSEAVLAEAMAIGWTQNVVILEAELTLQERIWYIRAVGQFGWSKLELTSKIEEFAHETAALDIVEDLCYSNRSRSDEDGTKEASGAFLQGLRDTEVQRELQRQGSCGSYRRGEIRSIPFPPTAKTALRSFAPPLPTRPAPLGSRGGPVTLPLDRERDEVAEKSNPRSSARGQDSGQYGLCGKVSAFGTEPDKTGKKQELSILTLELSINGDICAPYGDLVYVSESYQISRTPPAIVCIQQEGSRQTVEPPSKILAKLLKWTVHMLEIFGGAKITASTPML